MSASNDTEKTSFLQMSFIVSCRAIILALKENEMSNFVTSSDNGAAYTEINVICVTQVPTSLITF